MVKTKNYQNGKIYKIVDKAYETCYIGSTIDTLNNRWTGHKKHYKEFLNQKHGHVSVFDLFDKYGVENCKIELVELYPCGSKIELHSREGYYQRQEDCVNKSIAGRSSTDYYKENKNCINQKQQKYYQEIKQDLSTKNKKKYQENKEIINERNRKYGNNAKFECECGCIVRMDSKSKHLKTNKHKYILQKNISNDNNASENNFTEIEQPKEEV